LQQAIGFLLHGLCFLDKFDKGLQLSKR
jgi:hypothetical protein